MIIIVIGLFLSLFLLFVYSCCKVAGESDRYMEDFKDENINYE